jgi:UDP-N-acetylmuramoylalanine--D-glutamate ligase
VLTLPQNGDRIRGAVLDEGGEAEGCADLTSAVRRSAAWAPPGGVVLLSPAAASFGVYASYRARSAAFRQAVRELDPSSL